MDALLNRFRKIYSSPFNCMIWSCYNGELFLDEIPVFSVDERIQSTCFTLDNWPLSQVLLKNEAQFPWLILVPRRIDVQEISQLDKEDRRILMEEINQLSLVVSHYFHHDKLNIGALGNIVSQLHVHVVARNKEDNLWPQGIWQAAFQAKPYEPNQLTLLVSALKELVGEAGKRII